MDIKKECEHQRARFFFNEVKKWFRLIIAERKLGGIGGFPLSSITPSSFSYMGVQTKLYGPW